MENKQYDKTNIVEFCRNNPEIGVKLIQRPWSMTIRKFEELFGPHGWTIIKRKSCYLLVHEDEPIHTKIRPVKESLNDIYNWSLKAFRKQEPRQVGTDEWLYRGCFIQKQDKHPELSGKFEVFKNNGKQTHVGRSDTFTGAKDLCESNECYDNFLVF